MKVALNHVLSTVFGFSCTDHPLHKALKADGIETIADLLTMEDTDIDRLTYRDGEQTKPVPKGLCDLVKVFKDYYVFRNSSDNPVDGDFTGILQTEFDALKYAFY